MGCRLSCIKSHDFSLLSIYFSFNGLKVQGSGFKGSEVHRLNWLIGFIAFESLAELTEITEFLFSPEKPGPLGLRLRFQPVGLTGRRVEPTPRRARSEISGYASKLYNRNNGMME
jgi:hypothetical protein